jgi:hypothetical protein
VGYEKNVIEVKVNSIRKVERNHTINAPFSCCLVEVLVNVGKKLNSIPRIRVDWPKKWIIEKPENLSPAKENMNKLKMTTVICLTCLRPIFFCIYIFMHFLCIKCRHSFWTNFQKYKSLTWKRENNTPPKRYRSSNYPISSFIFFFSFSSTAFLIYLYTLLNVNVIMCLPFISSDLYAVFVVFFSNSSVFFFLIFLKCTLQIEFNTWYGNTIN